MIGGSLVLKPDEELRIRRAAIESLRVHGAVQRATYLELLLQLDLLVEMLDAGRLRLARSSASELWHHVDELARQE